MKGWMCMNIFEDQACFIRGSDSISKRATVKNILDLAAEIRGQLGSKGYLMDKYLSLILEAANQILCHDAANEGFEAGSELRRFCTTETSESHPFFEKAKELMENHPLDFQERTTKCDIYFSLLADEFLASVLEEQASGWNDSIRKDLDVIYLRDLFRNISSVVGEDKMEELNLLIKQRFFRVSPADAFAQGFTNDLLYCLNHRDVETGKLVWQLIGE